MLSRVGTMGGAFQSMSSGQMELEYLTDSLQINPSLEVYNDHFDDRGHESRDDLINEFDASAEHGLILVRPVRTTPSDRSYV